MDRNDLLTGFAWTLYHWCDCWLLHYDATVLDLSYIGQQLCTEGMTFVNDQRTPANSHTIITLLFAGACDQHLYNSWAIRRRLWIVTPFFLDEKNQRNIYVLVIDMSRLQTDRIWESRDFNCNMAERVNVECYN